MTLNVRSRVICPGIEIWYIAGSKSALGWSPATKLVQNECTDPSPTTTITCFQCTFVCVTWKLSSPHFPPVLHLHCTHHVWFTKPSVPERFPRLLQSQKKKGTINPQVPLVFSVCHLAVCEKEPPVAPHLSEGAQNSSSAFHAPCYATGGRDIPRKWILQRFKRLEVFKFNYTTPEKKKKKKRRQKAVQHSAITVQSIHMVVFEHIHWAAMFALSLWSEATHSWQTCKTSRQYYSVILHPCYPTRH